MSTIQSHQLQQYVGRKITVQGHAQSVRDLGNLMFITVRDNSGCVQAVVSEKTVLEAARAVSTEAAIIVSGSVTQMADKAAEIQAESIEVLSSSGFALPVEIAKEAKMDSLSISAMLDYRPLTLRNPKVRAIFKIQAAICQAFSEFLIGENFVEIHSPKIVSTGTEGGANLFKLDYFGKEAFLAQSPQFYKQIMVGVFERVFEVGPVYRAEQHDTTRHVNEYISLDLEMGFIKSEQDVIALQVRLMKHIFARVKERCAAELAMYGARVPKFETIPQMRLSDAQALLTRELGWKPASDTVDLDPEAERLLCEHFANKEGIDLLYLTHYPHAVRPFYAMPEAWAAAAPAPGNAPPAEAPGMPEAHASAPLPAGASSHSFDLLFRGLEVTTGGQRIHKYDELIASMEGRDLNPEKFADYLQCFRYGMPPHGGLAIGLERLVKQLLGLPSVKLAVLFPRDLNRLTP